MFEKINFKYSDASEEKIYSPEIINDCYVDLMGILTEVNDPAKFIIIGTKGAGKSALASKIQMDSGPEWSKFVATDDLEEFEFNLLEKTGGEKGKVIGGAISVWQLLLLIRMLDLLIKDELFQFQNSNVLQLHNAMQSHGLSPSASLVAIVQQTSRRGAFVTFKAVQAELRGESTVESTSKLKDPAAVLQVIKELIGNCHPTTSSFRLIIDGLDHPLRNNTNTQVI